MDVVFLCLRLLPELGAFPAPLGAADLDPTLVLDAAGPGCIFETNYEFES